MSGGSTASFSQRRVPHPFEALKVMHVLGLREAFKLDYVYLKVLPGAATVMTRLPKWIEDHNRSHPYLGLKMKSTWE